MKALKRMKTVVIDDESKDRLAIIGVIGDLGLLDSCLEIVGEAKDATDGLPLIKAFQPELIFLDLAMPGLMGFQFPELVATKEYKPSIIYLTKYYQDFEETTRKRSDFLVPNTILKKPANPDALDEACRRIYENWQKEVAVITIVDTSGFEREVPQGEICLIDIKEDKLHFFLNNGNSIVESRRISLLSILNLLDSSMFVRVSKFAIANLNFYNGISLSKEVLLITQGANELKVTVGASFQAAVLSKLGRG